MNKLVATTLEANIHLYDLRTFHKTKGFSSLTEKAHKSTTIWSVRHLPQNREVFMTTGGNGSLNLWKYSYPSHRHKTTDNGDTIGVMGNMQLLQSVTFSSQPISSLDWNNDKEGLFACTSFDQTLRICITTRLNII
jgi:WD40 repeat protein